MQVSGLGEGEEEEAEAAASPARSSRERPWARARGLDKTNVDVFEAAGTLRQTVTTGVLGGCWAKVLAITWSMLLVGLATARHGGGVGGVVGAGVGVGGGVGARRWRRT